MGGMTILVPFMYQIQYFMKTRKIILAAFAVLMTFSLSFGQSRNFKFGVKGGANLSNLRGDDVVATNDPSIRIGNADARLTGFVGGVFVRFGSSIFIQPELLLSQKGGAFNVFRSGVGNEQNTVNVRFTNLDVPFMLGIRIGDVLRINAGPIASLRLSENGGLRDALNDVGATSVKDNFNQAALGYQAGVGFDIGNLSLDLRYEGNVTNIVDVNTNNSNFNSQLKRKGSLYQATIGFAIF
ncbi:outer membrane beta-barrel protein [Cytophagaceae bacterium SJW1-29]|uniref:Outer membrane beta-barrel protein n=2 Tax=Salmonirosea aquatica TaxID=2654236 RepID=A0A7C9FTA5_9BACT|nr:outer membrane beta-barrel protein [Cytophagaceae bacterium SJW1-29]